MQLLETLDEGHAFAGCGQSLYTKGTAKAAVPKGLNNVYENPFPNSVPQGG
jgi:hypothetical protein